MANAVLHDSMANAIRFLAVDAVDSRRRAEAPALRVAIHRLRESGGEGTMAEARMTRVEAAGSDRKRDPSCRSETKAAAESRRRSSRGIATSTASERGAHDVLSVVGSLCEKRTTSRFWRVS